MYSIEVVKGTAHDPHHPRDPEQSVTVTWHNLRPVPPMLSRITLNGVLVVLSALTPLMTSWT